MINKPIVFVSSTIADLTNERVAAKRAIEKIPATPRLSEFTVEAQDRPSKEVCENEVKRADIYVLILGGSYGWTFDDGISVTELEWETAKRENKPILVFNTSYPKEEKQKGFEKKVGDFQTGRFYKKVQNAFELEESIVSALRMLLREEKFKIKAQTERVYANFIEIFFPSRVFTGDWDFNRDEIIESSKKSEKALRYDASDREVVLEALRQKGFRFSTDWVTNSNKIITFHDLGEAKLPLSKLVDQGTVGSLSSKDFYSISNDYENIFKSLLRFCLKQKLFKMKIEWFHEDSIFAFMPQEENYKTRKEKWHGRKDVTREVFVAKRSASDPDKIYYCRHLAFACKFELLDDRWYLSITPDWFITYLAKDDKLRKSKFGYEKVAKLKRLEKNQSVFNHLKFLVYKLKYGDPETLFRRGYPFLSFGKLVSFESYPKVTDLDWLKKEKKAAQNSMRDTQLSLPLPY